MIAPHESTDSGVSKTIVIIGTLDTKGEELKYIKELIERRGHKTIAIDGGVLGEPFFRPDISRDEVARAAGMSLAEVIALGDEGKAMGVMGRGASKIAQGLCSEGRMDGIVALGGTTGTTFAAIAMKELPMWLPKLMVSVSAFSVFFDPEMVSKDLVLMPTVVDLWGFDDITRGILESAAGAISGMVETRESKGISEKPLIGITTVGTAGCKHVLWAKPLLERKGYNVVVFPGYGTTFEELIERGLIAGTLDFMACLQLSNALAGAPNSAGPNRFEAGRKRGLPQVFAPAVVEQLAWAGSIESLPPRFQGRKVRQHNMFAGNIKASKEEMATAGETMAQKLSQMTGPTAMLLPSQGFSEMDKPGGVFCDPEGRKAFIEAFKRSAGAKVQVVELDLHLNDPEFAEQAVAILDEMMRQRPQPVPEC